LDNHYHFTADPGQQPMRLDLYLTQQIANATRSKVQDGIKAGHVLVNGNPAKSSYLIQPDDVIEVTLPKPAPPEAAPEDIPLDVVFEDDALMVINKPAGMVVHPAFGNWTGTLVNAVLHHAKELTEWDTDEDDVLRPGIVHRLDKDTSGLLVIAKNERAHAFLAAQFAVHSVDREYRALVWGKPGSGTINADLGRHPKDRKKVAVFPDGAGKRAVTHFTTLEEPDVFSLLSVKLETGRTHQIRVHLAHKGHPVFGDRTYGGDQVRFGQNVGRRKHFFEQLLEEMPRQALHAAVLGFEHPVTGARMRFEAPLPADFQHVLEAMRAFGALGLR
jgi:23S rRNA pseudouridine1911/1915/1917 synthase